MGMRAIRFTGPRQARAGLAGILGPDGLAEAERKV
jgi:hypothetical protein